MHTETFELLRQRRAGNPSLISQLKCAGRKMVFIDKI